MKIKEIGQSAAKSRIEKGSSTIESTFIMEASRVGRNFPKRMDFKLKNFGQRKHDKYIALKNSLK